MTAPKPRLALTAWLAVQLSLYAFAFAWVAFYSLAIAPGHAHAHYEAHAQLSSPIVASLVSLPACLLAARWIRRRAGPRDARPTTYAAAGILIGVDIALTLAIAPLADAWICAVAIPFKLGGFWLGLRGATPAAAAEDEEAPAVAT